jgi:hypothetical protein
MLIDLKTTSNLAKLYNLPNEKSTLRIDQSVCPVVMLLKEPKTALTFALEPLNVVDGNVGIEPYVNKICVWVW